MPSDGAPEPDGALKAVAGAKFSTIDKFDSFDQTQSLSCPSQSTLQAACMLTSVVYYFCMLIVKHLLMNYQRNWINFASFALLV
jgi:hypothetical protein